MNTPIKDLLKQYDMEKVTNKRLIEASLRYVDTMGDSQVRCLLYVLVDKLIEEKEC